jgi:hypothetical protein
MPRIRFNFSQRLYSKDVSKKGGMGGEGDLPVVWHFSHGENRWGATNVYIRCCYQGSGAALFFISHRSVGKGENTSTIVGYCIL